MADSASPMKSPSLPDSHQPTEGTVELTPQAKDPARIPRPSGAPNGTTIQAHASYEVKLRSIKNGALLVAGLQKTSRFLGICALTWASVVLLGGFASALKIFDFYLISILLLVEAARLSTTEFFSKLLTKTLFREGRRPEEFEFKDLQNFLASRLDWIGQGCTGLFAMLSLTSALVRFGISRHHPFKERDQSANVVSNISPSLYTFYILVVLNSSSTVLSCIMRPYFRRSSEDSLMSYHDEVYKVAMTLGMPDADDIDVLEFAFKKLASDYARNIRPITIKLRNSELIKFIYYRENGVGVTCEHLRSSDVWKQVVAAALPGFWALELKIEKQVALFWALQDRLYRAGKVVEIAASSITSLSKAWAEYSEQQQYPFLIIDPNRGNKQNVVDSVIDLVLNPIQSSLLFQLRALEGCCRSRQVLKHIYNKGGQEHGELHQQLQNLIPGANQQRAGDRNAQLSRPEELCLKLVNILDSTQVRQTSKMHAASALHALLYFGGELEEDAKERLKDMVDKKIDLSDLMQVTEGSHGGPYVWQDEKNMLDKLRESLGLSLFDHWSRIRVLGPDGKQQPWTSKPVSHQQQW